MYKIMSSRIITRVNSILCARKISKRKLCLFIFTFGTVCMLFYFYLYFAITNAPFTFLNWMFSREMSSSKLLQLMSDKVSLNAFNIMFLLDTTMFHFYDLPKRKLSLFTEITSANRDTSYPLAPDFSFHINYYNDSVQIYEDHGPGCIYRTFLFPLLPRDADSLYRMSSYDLADMFLLFEIDDYQFKFSLHNMMDGRKWPFLYPLNTRHPKVASGMGSYFPICYSNYAKIIYGTNTIIPKNLLNKTLECTKNDLLCPIHIYSAVSRQKFFISSNVELRKEVIASKYLLNQIAGILSKPEENGPNKNKLCSLTCISLCPSCRKVIFNTQEAGVISSIFMRVFSSNGKLLTNWNSILLSMHFDDASSIQVQRLPLGWLFGVTSSLNDFIGSAAGHRKKHCFYDEKIANLPFVTMTGYSYFPMPYWQNAIIVLEGSEYLHDEVLICYQVNVVPNHYSFTSTGHFYVHATYYGDDVSGWRNLLTVNDTWGHVVALYANVDHLKAVRGVDVNERWAMLQADFDIFIDEAHSASVLGTGLEDYFSYSHGFTFAENTTYSFTGVYHTSPRRKEPLTFHSYRFHVLDPIPFQRAIQLISEGTSSKTFQHSTASISYAEYQHRLINELTSVSYLVVYYAGRSTGARLSDKLIFGDTNSEIMHFFSTVLTCDLLQLTNLRYIGAKNCNKTFSFNARKFLIGNKVMFTLNVSLPNIGAILRRNFYSSPLAWNEKAVVNINGHDCGIWFIAMGSLNNDYSLREEDFLVDPSLTQTATIFVEITPLTVMVDISYELFVIF